jgi:hypothetical protein
VTKTPDQIETVPVKKRVAKAERKQTESNNRRGQKPESWHHYYNDTKEKIAMYKHKLETANENGYNGKQKKAWRNTMTA